jgi:hypothetical protein
MSLKLATASLVQALMGSWIVVFFGVVVVDSPNSYNIPQTKETRRLAAFHDNKQWNSFHSSPRLQNFSIVVSHQTRQARTVQKRYVEATETLLGVLPLANFLE